MIRKHVLEHLDDQDSARFDVATLHLALPTWSTTGHTRAKRRLFYTRCGSVIFFMFRRSGFNERTFDWYPWSFRAVIDFL